MSPRPPGIDFKVWGTDIQPEALDQMRNACALPISVAAALMPDAHVGYGLPIGGVLATDAAVIPYAVGVDIACRMKMSVFDWPVDALDTRAEALRAALEQQTRFGVGSHFDRPRAHAVMDADWSVSPVTARNRSRAHSQLGTSGSGNHFVEFGTLTVSSAMPGLAAGRYVALLSHSGSRGTGAAVCDYYSKRAMERHAVTLPDAFKRLAWLPLDSAEGQEYWAAMELMGQYAAANHASIHEAMAKHLGAEILFGIENHHNFAWKEVHGGRELVVHRKGATPASAGVLGIIPGSMATPGFVVRGKGSPAALHSAAHGAGRCMSRTAAARTLDWKRAHALLAERGVTLLSAGIDEVPMVYKDIHAVMAAQADLIEPLAQFDPRIVKMCPSGERPED
jgi:tRNA-splicing ligase RtcB